MRIASVLLAFAAFTAPLTPALLVPATALHAQAPAGMPPCTGTVNIVRVSEIKPGMMAKFIEAAAAQQAWYKNAGTSDKISVMRIIQQDPKTKAYGFSETEALTSHTEAGDRAKGPAHDAGYDAFVALYQASSTIKTQYITCMDK